MGLLFKALYIITGINFSGYCHGPKLLQELVTIAGNPYVLFQAFTKWSLAAFVAEYGLLGSY